jgi:hypothetical protein
VGLPGRRGGRLGGGAVSVKGLAIILALIAVGAVLCLALVLVLATWG